MSKKAAIVDVREDIKSGRDPFSKIMGAVAALAEDQDLVVRAPFEPVPLFAVLRQRGFSHQATPLSGGDWEVSFSRNDGAGDAADKGPVETPVDTTATSMDVDARGLEPPQPLVKILEAVAALPTGATLRAHTDRRPMHLYAQLEERGFHGETKEQPDGSFVTHVTHR